MQLVVAVANCHEHCSGTRCRGRFTVIASFFLFLVIYIFFYFLFSHWDFFFARRSISGFSLMMQVYIRQTKKRKKKKRWRR